MSYSFFSPTNGTCGNTICSDICVGFDYSSGTYSEMLCAPSSVFYLSNSHYMFWILYIVSLFPNVFLYTLSRMLAKVHSSAYSLFYGISVTTMIMFQFSNIVVMSYIGSRNYELTMVILCPCLLFIFYVSFGCCCCPGRDKALKPAAFKFIYNLMSTPAKEYSRARERFDAYQGLPPEIRIEGHPDKTKDCCCKECCAENTSYNPLLHTSEGSPQYAMNSRVNCNFNYKTWIGNDADFPQLSRPLTLVYMKTDYSFTQTLASEIQTKIQELTPVAFGIDAESTINVKMDLPGFREYFVVSNSDAIPCLHSFTSSCFGKLFWHMLTLFGQNVAFESIWTLFADKIELSIRKSLSDGDEFPNKAGESRMSSNFSRAIPSYIRIIPEKTVQEPSKGASSGRPTRTMDTPLIQAG